MKILNRYTGETIFDFKCRTKKKCLEESVRQKINLQYADLRDADLQYADLQGVNLRGADLRCANLRGADLRGADLQDADLRCANLQYADLQGVNLRGADLWGANLWDADLRGADLQDAYLQCANLQYADLQGVNLWGEKLTKNPVYINAGLRWEVWITDKRIKIGCQLHSTKAWENFTYEQISKMSEDALDFWEVWKKPILEMAKAHQGVEKDE